MFVYILQVYIDIYVCVSLGGHNLRTFYATMWKFGMLLTQTLTFSFVLELLLGFALGQNV